MAIFPGSAIPSAAEAYTIDNSLRFDDGSSSYMERTPGSAGNRKTWTWSCWAKRASGFGSDQQLFNAWEDDSNRFSFIFSNSANKLQVYELVSGVDAWNISSNAIYRDPGAWQHIMLVKDATNGVAADRGKIYVNGLQVDVTAATTLSDVDGIVNKEILHSIGKENHSTGNYGFMDGYLAEVYFIDGTALTPSSFGELDSTTNQWIPIDASGLTFGTNGFYQKYAFTGGPTSFTADGTYTVPAGVTSVDYLVVAGGGGGGGSGGSYGGGGGGAGGYLTGTLSVTPGADYSITVGDGGAAGAIGAVGGDGDNSVFSTITSTGGGGGGGQDTRAGRDGGSGGGSSGNNGGGGTASQGNNGGNSTASTRPGSGGGGSGAVGVNNSSASWAIPADGSAGGAGTSNSITGSAVVYAGGGGSGGFIQTGYSPNSATGGSGGTGGGGAGGSPTESVDGTSVNGTANTGGGGGGGGGNWAGTGLAGATGGSGIVILKPGAENFGSDSSGEGNNFTVTNLAVTDQMIDTPTNNWCTLNPLDIESGASLSEGNLEMTSGVSDNGGCRGTMFAGLLVSGIGNFMWRMQMLVRM